MRTTARGSPMEQFERVQRRPVEGRRGMLRSGVGMVRVWVGRGTFGERRVTLGTGSRREGRSLFGGVTQGAVMMAGTVGLVKRRWKREEEDTVLPTMVNRVTEGREVGVMEMVGPMMGHSGEKRYEVVKTQMQMVRRLNRGGLVPYSYCITSQLVVAARRAVSMWVWKRVRGVQAHGVKLLGRRRPTGTPLVMVPMMVALERRGFFLTGISLSVRLFANRMAGHILLKVLGGFGWVRRAGSDVRGRRPLRVLRRLFVLETAVAGVQAYVFTLLRCIYRTDMVKGGH
jgi:F-type H+-transporting ATPase subunit a